MLTKKDVPCIQGVEVIRHADILDDMFSDPLEEWRHAANHELAEGRLLVSSYGRIARLPFTRRSGVVSRFSVIRGTPQYRGHLEISWSVEWNRRDTRGTPKRARAHAHQLVARAFLGPPPIGIKRAVVRHKNGNPADNHVSNPVLGSDLQNQYDRLSEPQTSATASYGLWIGPSLHRRILAAVSGELDPILVLKDLDTRIRTSIPINSDDK